jgi:hypothetical protein
MGIVLVWQVALNPDDYRLFMAPDALFSKVYFPFRTGWKVICRLTSIDSAIHMGVDRGRLGGSLPIPKLPLSSPPTTTLLP